MKSDATSPSSPRSRSEFVEGYLYSLVGEESTSRAVLAALRRGLGKRPGTCLEMLPFVAGRIPGFIQSARAEEPYYLVASLFALHPRYRNPGAEQEDLGRSLQRLPDHLRSSSLELRFQALLSAHWEQLHHHLRQVVSLLRSGDTPIDYATLLRDLQYWDHPSRTVQRRWARSFWGDPGGSASRTENQSSHPGQKDQ